MARAGIAATLASVVLFTGLVVADATIMVAQDNLSSSAMATRIEVREGLLAAAIAGEVSMGSLEMAQSYLANPASCGAIAEYLSGASGSDSLSGLDDGIGYVVNASATFTQTGAATDNLTLVAPFSGASPGALNLEERLTIHEVGGGGTVSLSRAEVHLLNIPISAGGAAALCPLVSGGLAAALRGSCNSTLATAAFASAFPSLEGDAAAQGFNLAAGWAWGGSRCSASYWFTLIEAGVRGPAGSFDWTVRGSGST